jgi:hypothetical protein
MAENIQNALGAGRSDVLTHGGDVAANRAPALRDVNSVQPQRPTCSNRQGGFLSGFGRAMRRLFGL